jgi:hypothetical protein
MRYVVIKKKRGKGYTIRDTKRSDNLPTIGDYPLKRDAEARCSKMNYDDEWTGHHLAEYEVVKLRDVAIGKRVQIVERASEHPPGKPYRALGDYVVVIGNPENDHVPCEDGHGKRRPIHKERDCRVLPG